MGCRRAKGCDMTLLEDIQQSAIDGKSDLAELLRKCKLLAARLGSKPLEDWLVWESNGYPKESSVPEYRIWPLQVFGHFSGPFGSGIRNAPIPIELLSFLSDKEKGWYRRHQCRESIAAIEAILRDSKKGKVAVTTGSLAVVIGTKLYQAQNCVQTWAEFEKGRLVEVLNAVRNRILDFALAVGNEAPSAGEMGEKSEKLEQARVNQIFNLTIHGGAANIIGTATDSSVTFNNIATKDFASLEKFLLEKGADPADIAELKEAVDSDTAPTSPGSFGTKVASWIGRMVAKAATGGWQIGAGAAGNLLADAMAKYYGF